MTQLSLLGYAIRLAAPQRLWLLAAVALLGALAVRSLLRRRRALREACGALAGRMAPEANLSRPAARLSLSLSGLALLAVALAQPQCGTRTELSSRYGADVVVVLDVSRSMEARDVRPSRLERARLEVGALLERLKGDRVGVVVFAGEAFVQCPLTTDYEAARLFLRSVGPGSVPQQGTALANALLGAKELLDGAERGSRSRVVLLVSDGEDHDGKVLDAVASARRRRRQGARARSGDDRRGADPDRRRPRRGDWLAPRQAREDGHDTARRDDAEARGRPRRGTPLLRRRRRPRARRPRRRARRAGAERAGRADHRDLRGPLRGRGLPGLPAPPRGAAPPRGQPVESPPLPRPRGGGAR